MQEALAGLEDGEVAEWVKGKEGALHYYTCKHLMMALLEGAQEGRIRNIFGMYTSMLLKAWDRVIRAYEKDNVYLGEAARVLIQNTTYACPNLRRRISAYEKQVGDCERRVAEYAKTVKDLEQQFGQACRDLGIDGKTKEGNFKTALVALTQGLPALFTELETSLQAAVVGEALTYHGDVQRFLLSYQEEKGGGEGQRAETFPVLRKVRQGETLSVGGGSEAGVECSKQEEEVAEIDGDVTPVEEGDIDWGEESTAATAAPPVEAAPASSATTTTEVGLLTDAGVRSELLNEVLELEAFLMQRRLELNDKDNVVFVGQYQGAHIALQNQNLATVDRYLEAVRLVLGKLRAKRLQQLVLIQSSPAYVDCLVLSLQQKLDHMAKIQRAITETQARREEAVGGLAQAMPEYEAIAAATKALKAKVEASLSALYKGRPVHITGEINSL